MRITKVIVAVLMALCMAVPIAAQDMSTDEMIEMLQEEPLETQIERVARITIAMAQIHDEHMIVLNEDIAMLKAQVEELQDLCEILTFIVNREGMEEVEPKAKPEEVNL